MSRTAIAGTLALLTLAACGSSSDERTTTTRSGSVTIVNSTPNAVVMTGPADAKRTSPPAVFADTAARECATHNKRATYFGMDAQSPRVTEVTYLCQPRRK